MRLLMFRDGAGRKLGALRDGDQVVDITAQGGPADLLALIDEGDAGLARVRALVESASATLPLDGLELLAPLDPPRGNVLAMGRNYLAHAQEGARAQGQAEVGAPTVFTKAITSITGPNGDFPFDPAVSEKIDWEVELAVVLGRRGINIEKEDALGHVFGYSVVNDISARDIQRNWGGQFFKGKSLDASCPFGPWVVTPDEVPDPQALRLTTTVNGVVKQDANTKDMIYPVAELIAWLSVGMTLLPGMVIATGTPEGVGFAREPAEFLRPGDLMVSEVEGIGALHNHIIPAKAPARA